MNGGREHGLGLLARILDPGGELERRSTRVVSFPVVVADHDGGRYLVSMLGDGTNWVRNVRAAGYDVVLRHRDSERVRLQEVDVAERAAILRRYLECAPGARSHFPVSKEAPLEDFERIAEAYPVFRLVTTRNPPTTPT